MDLKQISKRASPQKDPSDKAIPGVFAGRGGFQYVPGSSESWNHPSVFSADFGDLGHQAGDRFTAYGRLAVQRAGLIPGSGVHPDWTHALTVATATTLMFRAGVGDVVLRERRKGRRKPKALCDFGYEALIAYGTMRYGRAINRAIKILKAQGRPSSAELAGPLFILAVNAAAFGRDSSGYLQQIQDIFGAPGTPPKPEAPHPDFTECFKPEEGKERGPDQEDEEGEGNGNGEGSHCWGNMTVQSIPMSLPRNTRNMHKRWARSIAGVFRYPWRAMKASDYQCFSIKRKKPGSGGTVLYDMSGSMRINREHIVRVLNTAPAATIAGYGSLPGDASSGRLVQIARDGRTGNPDEARKRIGIGNIVDGPALRWLGTQAEPRIWVCDGQVTGIGDLLADARMRKEVDSLCKKFRITRIPSAAAMDKLLLEGGQS